jgi:hypothetical protein
LTPEKEYAPTTTDVGPVIVTTMSAATVGPVRYQNSASLLTKEPAARVSWDPPKVIPATAWSFASTPTTRRRSLPAPALTLDNTTRYGVDDTVPDVAWTTLSDMPVALLLGTAVGPAADVGESMTSGTPLKAIRKNVAKTRGLLSSFPLLMSFLT